MNQIIAYVDKYISIREYYKNIVRKHETMVFHVSMQCVWN